MHQHAAALSKCFHYELEGLLQGGGRGSGEGEAEVADAVVGEAVGLQRVGAVHN